jgi:hypothetical protein
MRIVEVGLWYLRHSLDGILVVQYVNEFVTVPLET